MLRYLRSLADKDIALDRSMIPLGSCTMKLNATTEMAAVTWPEFGQLHPFVPARPGRGLPRADHLARGVAGRDHRLRPGVAPAQRRLPGRAGRAARHPRLPRVPRRGRPATCASSRRSAHGTNAASAVMAGMRVVVVACDDDGNVDLDDLEAKVEEHAADLAALMVTYPSTHGVFEERITDICDLVHEHGGQVYVDGANLNALVGIARPGWFGGDVSHLNLHKTFCIPHGGGGPGVGPVAVREHLAPFLPNHPLAPEAGPATGPGPDLGGAVRLGVDPADLLGLHRADGPRRPAPGHRAGHPQRQLRRRPPRRRLSRCSTRATTTASPTSASSTCARSPQATGVTVDDVAKRLIDFGFHAPTMSFPVAGTLMVEPTESESLAELDRFVDAMLAIRDEIAQIERGEVAHDDSALAHAPHTAEDVLVADWDRPYTAGAGRLPAPQPPRRQVLAAGQPHRRRLRRPQPRVRLPPTGGLRVSAAACPAATASRGAASPAGSWPPPRVEHGLVEIPAGRFSMGSAADVSYPEDGRHRCTTSRSARSPSTRTRSPTIATPVRRRDGPRHGG